MTLKSIIEALLFAAHKPLSPAEIRSVLAGEGDEKAEAALVAFKRVKEAEIAAAIEELKVDYIQADRSFTIAEIAGGFQLVSKPDYAIWLKRLLDVDRPSRLSPSALETLAIIAYRQPITRVEIEAVRGVNVDGVLRTLLERGLVKITGRSDLPGRPLQYGTTQAFLEHFGLRDLEDLPAVDELRRIEAKRHRAAAPAAPAPTPAEAQKPPAPPETAP
ncbi:MAG: SMC-Scp complex subunit ScpB [Verrucomicrobiae bacterium]|nr:SMC-Scp complex subunit ScpB [Verrucomicrobiae bacterium]